MQKSQAVVTGFGSVSALGVNNEQIWESLFAADKRHGLYDSTLAEPFITYPVAEFEPLEFVDSKSIIRTVSRSQLHAMVAVSQALKNAGLDREHPLIEDACILVACNDGNRDEERDEKLYKSWFEDPSTNFDTHLNQHFSRARPSNFLAQLPNLFATNITSYFKIGGETLTFTGDELAGMNALDQAIKKIETGQSELLIVGGVADGLKEHLMLYAALDDRLCSNEFREVWEREANQMCLGSGAAFLVLESSSHAQARDVETAYEIGDLSIQVNDRSAADFSTSAHQHLLRSLGTEANDPQAIISCSAGNGILAATEAQLLSQVDPNLAVRSITNYTGALLEASMPFGVATACLALSNNKVIPPFSDTSGLEKNLSQDEELNSLLVNCWGHYMGEANLVLRRLQK